MTVEISTLPNGLRVVTDRIDTVETAALGIWVGVGTRHEAAEENGVSHLLEHMAFKGTARRSAEQIVAEIEAVGGHLNAYTSRETTAYYARILKDDVALATDILADILQNAVFDPQELERERSVILQEIGQSLDQPEDLVFDAFQLTAYPDQPMGRPVLGTPDVVARLGRDDVAGYMRRWYRAPGMIFAAAGRVEHRQMVALAEEMLGGLDGIGNAAPPPAVYRGGESRDEQDLEQAHLVLGFEGVAFGDPDYYAAQVLSTLYGGGMSSRLFQEIREKRGLVYSIYSFSSSASDGGVFGVYAGTGAEQATEVATITCAELGALTAEVGGDELRRARAQLKASTLMSRESTSARCEQAAQHMLVYGRPLGIDEIVAEIDRVDEAAVARVAGRIASSPLTLAAVGPVGALVPLPDLEARLR